MGNTIVQLRDHGRSGLIATLR